MAAVAESTSSCVRPTQSAVIVNGQKEPSADTDSPPADVQSQQSQHTPPLQPDTLNQADQSQAQPQPDNEDTTVEDTTLEDVTLGDTTLENTTLENTTLENTTSSDKDFKTAAPANSTDAQPLAPPPKPLQKNAPDQTDRNVNKENRFNLEPNPFEQSFGNQSSDPQGKHLLPSVANLTSPASLLPGGTPGWSNSLRSGPLSPAMLAGPAGGDYFSENHFRGGFPTPNESSLRTGLTPGGGGSMFPAPSPNTQALFNSLQGNASGVTPATTTAAGGGPTGGATPNMLDFHRTALSAAAAAATKPPAFNLKSDTPLHSRSGHKSSATTTTTTTSSSHNTASTAATSTVDQKPFQPSNPSQSSNTPHDPFAQHDTDAANGLYMLANANGSRSSTHFSVANPSGQAGTDRMASDSVDDVMPGRSPVQNKPKTNRSSIVSLSAGSANGASEIGNFSDSGQSEQEKPTLARPRSKKTSHARNASNATTAASSNASMSNVNAGGSRRKADSSPALKAPPIKRSRKNDMSIDTAADMMDDMDDSGGENSPQLDMKGEGGNRKMTDEEKRKNFLERNRVAALKCRQRKKQWLANLQAKVELFSTENDALTAQVTQMREEVVNLKTLLIAHKDCPVSQAQGLSGLAMQSLLGDMAHHANPYGGIGMHHPNGAGGAASAGMQRR